MGRVLYKPEKETDFYVIFSTISDLPIFAGTAREYLAEAVAEQFRNKFTTYNCLPHDFIRAIEVADQEGSNSWYRGSESWVFDVNWAGWGTIPASKLIEVVKIYFEDPENNWNDPRILALGDKFDLGDEDDEE